MDMSSPIGRLLLTADTTALTGRYMEVSGRNGGPVLGAAARADAGAGVLPAAAQQLAEYFAGTRRHFDVPLAWHGTSFQDQVWRALTEIPYGATWSSGRAIRWPGVAAGLGVPCRRSTNCGPLRCRGSYRSRDCRRPGRP